MKLHELKLIILDFHLAAFKRGIARVLGDGKGEFSMLTIRTMVHGVSVFYPPNSREDENMDCPKYSMLMIMMMVH